MKVKHPKRHWQELKLEKGDKRNYLSQIEALKKANPDLIIAPYFKRESMEKIGLSNYFYIKLKRADDFEMMTEQIKKYDVELIGQNQFMPLWYRVSVTPDTPNALRMANIFYETGLFQYATPDLLAAMPDNVQTHQTTTALTPNDPLYSDQWHLKNTGQHGGIPGMDINAEAAWDITLGDNSIVVAVIDEGFQTNHPDLIDNVVNNGYDSPSGTTSANVYGPHGTPCAGIIGAKGNNNQGVSGVAPNTGLMPVSFEYGTTSLGRVANAVSWAWMNGADVISNSWTSTESELISDAIENALTMGRGGLGAVVVFSAGNSGFPVNFPSNAHPDILAVGMMSPCGERITPSSCDGIFALSNFGVDLDVMAPGVLISTTDLQSVGGYNTGNNSEDYADLDYHYAFGGTSSACPQVSGVAALVLSLNPNLTGQEVRDIIEQSARKVRTDLYTYENTAGRPNGLWNGEMGYGLLDAYAAVSLATDEALICPLDMTVICAADIVPGAAEFQTTCGTGSDVAVAGPVIDGVPDCPGTTYTYTFTGTDDCGLQRTCTQTFIIDDNATSTTEEVTLISENDLFVGVTDEESFASNGTYVFTDTTTPAGAAISRIILTLYYRVEGASCESDIEFRLSDPAGNVIYTGTPFSTCDGSGTHPAGELYSLTHSILVETTTSNISNWVLEFRDTNDQNANAAEYSVRFGRLRYDAVVTTQDAESCCGTTTSEFTSCPEDISLTITPGYCGGIATWTPPTATGGTINSTHNPGDEFPVGCTTVIYTIEGTDLTCSFEVCVEECSDGGTPGIPTTETITLISENDLFIGAADAESFASNGTYLFADPGTPVAATISNATLQLFFRVENASCESDIEIRLNGPAGNVVYTGGLFTTCNGSGTHPAGDLYSTTIPISGGNTTGSTANWVLEFRDTNDQNTNAVEYSVRFGRLIYDATVTTSSESTETITLIDDVDAFVGFNDMESFDSNTTYTFSDPATPANAVLSNITLQLFFRVEGASCENEIEIRVNDPTGNVVYTGPMFATCNGSGTHPFGDLYQNTISLPGGTAMTTGNTDDWVVEFRDTNDQNVGANEYSVRFGRLIYDATITTTGTGGGCTEPVIVNCPADITAAAPSGECEAAVSVPVPQFGADFIDCTSATIANDYTGTADASAIYPAGTTTVTWMVTNAGGSTATCTQNITVNPGFTASDAVELINDSDLLIGGIDTENFNDNGTYVFTDPATPVGAALSNIRLLLFFRVENASCESDIEIRVNDPAGNVVYTGSPFTTCDGSGTHPFGQLYNTTITIPNASTTGSLDNWVVEFRDTNDQNAGATEYSVRFGRINYDVGSMLDCDPMLINQGGTPSMTNLLVEEAIIHDIKLYPIPTMGGLNLEYIADKDEQIQIEIFNVNGQALRSIKEQVFKEVNVIELDVYELPDGIYYVRTIDNLGTTKVKPFTKLAP